MRQAIQRVAALFAVGLAACGGGGDVAPSAPLGGSNDGSGGPTDGGSGGSGSFAVTYTHDANLPNWEWAVGWFVEDTGTVAGPFDSGGTGVVGLGAKRFSTSRSWTRRPSPSATTPGTAISHR